MLINYLVVVVVVSYQYYSFIIDMRLCLLYRQIYQKTWWKFCQFKIISLKIPQQCLKLVFIYMKNVGDSLIKKILKNYVFHSAIIIYFKFVLYKLLEFQIDIQPLTKSSYYAQHSKLILFLYHSYSICVHGTNAQNVQTLGRS